MCKNCSKENIQSSAISVKLDWPSVSNEPINYNTYLYLAKYAVNTALTYYCLLKLK